MNEILPPQEIIREARAILIQQIADLEKALDVPVLDGTPWLLIRTRGNLDMVYGEWPQIDMGEITQGWLYLIEATHHLNGAVMMNAKDVQRHIDNLRVHGEVARRMHVREFQVVRLDQLRRSLSMCDEMLARTNN